MDDKKRKSKIQAYKVRYKIKRKKSDLPSENLFYDLIELGKKSYNREKLENSRLRVIDKENKIYMSFDIYNFNLDKKIELVEKNYNYIDFYIGKEISENIPTRDYSGHEDSYNLPDGRRFFFKTHGRFIFKKINDEWRCVLLFEKKHDSISLKTFEYYLKLVFKDRTIIFEPLVRKESLKELINSIEPFEIYMNEAPISFYDLKDEKIGDQIEKFSKNKNKPLIAKLIIPAKNVFGESLLDKLINLFKMTNNNIDLNIKDDELKELIILKKLKVYGKRDDEKNPRTFDLLSDVYLFYIEYKLNENNLVDSFVIFSKIKESLSKDIIEELFQF